MQLYNLAQPSQQVSFSQAVMLGLGQGRGLFFPSAIPVVADIHALLAMPFVARSQEIIHLWLGDEIPRHITDAWVAEAFNFPLPLVAVDPQRWALELFHGPTLAFKDFGARFMARCIDYLAGKQADGQAQAPLTILTATSGDTGAAVADAFYGLEQVQVVVLYPQGKISALQEKMFATLDGNIHALAVDGDFDACQALVKQAFDDDGLREDIALNSANSINISRLLAQICYYFEAVAALRALHPDQETVIAVPSGNFGNLTAGLLARVMGLPVTRFIAATNSNDTVPRFLADGHWQVHPTQATMSNAMDVADPSNWPRAATLLASNAGAMLSACSLTEAATREAMQQLLSVGYQSEPHGAIAAAALSQSLTKNERGIFLATAHPAKFKDVVDRELALNLPLPPALQQVADKPLLSTPLAADYPALKKILQSLHGVQ
ncbi:threonine synthase [Shewanella sp. NFH-SH190041]|uniref:threonine synthase n=1 Tax=Shewanella sp. NFH-SH190041 TaxID=2950245 RepID=UPI0021C37EB1|nr:threonine synthase [Shewanella sp. NFH-SH190041]BDM63653.1 threonine synthase [Shewanella sp. NFH-SH190041]